MICHTTGLASACTKLQNAPEIFPSWRHHLCHWGALVWGLLVGRWEWSKGFGIHQGGWEGLLVWKGKGTVQVTCCDGYRRAWGRMAESSPKNPWASAVRGCPSAGPILQGLWDSEPADLNMFVFLLFAKCS